MKSPLPKVLHEVGGVSMILRVLRSVQKAAPGIPIAVVVGHGREQVEEAILAAPSIDSSTITFVVQKELKGTGDAVRSAMDSGWGLKIQKESRQVLVLPGDLPLLSAELVSEMLAPLPARKASIRMLAVELQDPTGYGRIVRRGKKGKVLKIVEERDAGAREKAILEVAVSIYLFPAAFLKAHLPRLQTTNAQKEYYLTDLVAIASRGDREVEVLRWARDEELRGVNDPWELTLACRLDRDHRVMELARSGVRFRDPSTTWVDLDVEIAAGVEIGEGVLLKGVTRIAAGAVIGPYSILEDAVIGEKVQIRPGCVIDSSEVAAEAQVGPYARLRPESHVGPGAKIGNFVELKKTRIGERTSVAHLSYLGDAEVGKRVNIGCGFVTCNYDGRVIDGRRKHPTIIEDDAFVGSDCQTVAPVTVGKGAYVASGSTITQDVAPDALAIARSRQVVKPGYASRLRAMDSENKE